MGLGRRLRQAWKDLRCRRRRVWSNGGRTHLEIRELGPQERPRFVAAAEEALGAIDGVEWARVNFPLRRIVVRHAARVDPAELESALDALETRIGFDEHPFPDDAHEHPADHEPIRRAVIEIGADGLGLALGMGLRLSRAKAGPLQFDLAALLAAIEGNPGARDLLDRKLGKIPAELTLHMAGAFIQGLLQGTTGPAVDIVRRGLRLRELRARLEVWQRLEEELCGLPESHVLEEPDVGARPSTLPPGPVEDYADKASFASLGAFGLGAVAGQNPTGATAAIFGGNPKPAMMGRDAFCSALGALLCWRGIVVLQTDALRRFDRIDRLVVEGPLLAANLGFNRDPDADAFRAAARAARFEVLTVEDPEPALDQVRRLQREGHGVAFVGSALIEGLGAADVAIGVPGSGRGPPWSAHLLCPAGLADAAATVHAIGIAREASRQGVQLAMIEAGMGLLLTLGGMRTGTLRRIMMASNAATLLSMVNGVRLAHRVSSHAPVRRQRTPWHALEVAEVLESLGTRDGGLNESEAVTRRPNGREAGVPSVPSFGEVVVDELTNPLTPVLVAGAGLSALAGSKIDATMITGVMGFNTLVGAVQRHRIHRTLLAMEHRERRDVSVCRNGRRGPVPRGELVVGDVIELGAGEVIPADCRIVEAYALEVDESSLTGESLPVAKDAASLDARTLLADRRCMLHDGTTVAAGRARAVVTAIGAETEVRRAAQEAERPITSGVEGRLERLTRLTAPAAVASGLALVASGVSRQRKPEEVIGTGVSLAVAAVPEGLPIVATMAQLAAAARLGKRGVLARNPRALEALGRIDVLCADKTGTLTEGRLQLRIVSDGRREAPVEALDGQLAPILSAALRAGPPPETPSSEVFHLTDRAVIDGAQRAGIEVVRGARGWRAVAELPFEPGRAFHAVLGESDGALRLSIKGAPEVLLPRCKGLGNVKRAHLQDEVMRLARRGLRVLAVAERTVPGAVELTDDVVDDLHFLGFVGFADPVRPAAKKAIDDLRSAGVGVVMVTGDHPSTAEAIAAEVGIADSRPVLTGPELDALDDDTLCARVEQTSVFARVTPDQKVRIVRALRRNDRVVAMTGDGANDAPAIRLADVGIALGARSSPAAREAADLVVTEERIETLIEAVLEGRALWSAVRDAVSLLVGGNVGEIGFTLAAGLWTGSPPLNARQLILVNLLTDTVPALALAVRRPRGTTPEELLREGPEASLGKALDRDILWRAGLTGGSAATAWLLARATGARKRADTVALLALVGSQMAQTLVASRGDRLVLGSSLASLGLLAGAVQTPGLSHFFGCRPLGPLGFLQAGTVSAAAAGIAWGVPRWLRRSAGGPACPEER